MNNAIETVLASLWRKSRFVSYFYQTVDFIRNQHVPTIALHIRDSRNVMYYNADFVDSLTVDEFTGLLVHELLHIVHNHNHRGLTGEDCMLQNLAQDMIVNSYIREHEKTFFSGGSGIGSAEALLVLPAGLPVIPEEYIRESGCADPRWEDLYRWLSAQPPDTIPDIDIDVFPLNEFDNEDGLSVSAENHILKKAADRDADSVTLPYNRTSDAEGIVFKDKDGAACMTGMHMLRNDPERMRLDANAERIFHMIRLDKDWESNRTFNEVSAIIEKLRDVDITSWRTLIKSYVDYFSQSAEWEYTYARFNRRYYSEGIYTPGRKFREKQILTVVVDVSGSMILKPEELESAFGVVEALQGKYIVHLVCVDEDVFIPRKDGEKFVPSDDYTTPYIYKKGDWKLIQTQKSGTTLFAPLFNRFMKGHRELLLIITDGYIYDMHSLRKYSPTVWVLPSGRMEPFAPPFGRVVTMRI